MKHKLCLILCVGLSLIAGCQQRPSDAKPTDEKQSKQNEEEKKANRPPEEVKLQVVKHAQLLDELKQYKGKVVLVDFWSTTCIPCMAKFPKVVKLYDAHHDEGLVCVSAAIICEKDDAMKFLKKVNSVMPNLLVEDHAEAQKHWVFTGIPAYYVIGRDGNILKNGRFSDEDFEVVHFEDAEKVVLAELAKK